VEGFESVEGVLKVEMVITAYFPEKFLPVNVRVATSIVGKSLNG
jgi:hypothetical protein